MRPYDDLNDDGYDSNSDYFYNVVVYPLDVSADAAPEHVTIEVGFKFLDEGVLRPFHRDHLRSFKINGVSTGDLSGIDDIARWLSHADDVPTSAADTALHLITDVLTEWPRARLAVVIITVNFFEDEDDVDDVVLRFLEEESGGERAPVVDVGGAADALEKVEVRDSETGTEFSSCVVCLEEFLVGVEVVRMPCLHVFHRDCIVKWLEKRHACPLCRFELQLTTTPSVDAIAVVLEE